MSQPDVVFTEPGVGGLVSTPFSWGNLMTDYDNDGDTDIVTHGGLDVGPFVEASNPGVIMQNDGYANFSYDLDALAESTNHAQRNVQGIAAGDLNNDGFVDIVSVSSLNIDEPLPLIPYEKQWGSDLDNIASIFPSFTPTEEGTFIYNELEPSEGTLSVEINSADNGNRWASIELLGSKGLTSKGKVNRDGIGAIVSFTPRGEKTVMTPVLGGGGYASQDSLIVNVGLKHARKGTVDVLWPGGTRNRLYGVRHNEHVVIPEIPCSYDSHMKPRKYKRCVRQSLKELRKQGLINKRESRRLMLSAMHAFHHESRN